MFQTIKPANKQTNNDGDMNNKENDRREGGRLNWQLIKSTAARPKLDGLQRSQRVVCFCYSQGKGMLPAV